MEAQTNGTGEVSGAVMGRRTRRSRKRLNFRPPQHFPRGVRELWTSATAVEQEKAHQACTRILALWLGRKPMPEVASELSIPPLRVWQLSQQALAGMMAGLLHQPRARRRRSLEATMAEQEEDPSALRKQLAQKDKRIAEQEELIRLLTELPKLRSESPKSDAPTSAAVKTRTRAPKAEASAGDVDGAAPPRAR